ncbi:hypothetical protein B0T26DRAFT_648042 [Lasiosphaeria miniovina]|uniref:BTB domain-containing protein n=1 Tax=Lasiosphaeria miniovina TaxID=1954250 RepID=A0AA40AMK6_9PEZI|nr:uncharacterized protein B0T26DRAFT_648042 [Lasiosphaeria miniovina]KAK0718622.1 hypothetical protein B0T26DRAFT_648042 [Lasiosphaeria miniovina]
MAKREEFLLDGNDDLRMVVLGREFVVCSRAVSRASPVFSCMLNGSWAEARPSDPSKAWIVDLPDDDAEAATVLLAVAHSRLDLVPALPHLYRLHQILVFSDKYDMTKSLRPWAISSTGSVKDPFCAIIGVAWELGAPEGLRAIATHMQFHCDLNCSGRLAMPMTGYPVEPTPEMPLMPPMLLSKHLC